MTQSLQLKEHPINLHLLIKERSSSSSLYLKKESVLTLEIDTGEGEGRILGNEGGEEMTLGRGGADQEVGIGTLEEIAIQDDTKGEARENDMPDHLIDVVGKSPLRRFILISNDNISRRRVTINFGMAFSGLLNPKLNWRASSNL